MHNVIQFAPARMQSAEARLAQLAEALVRHRRLGDDVMWLKENAEFLNVCECTGQPVGAEMLEIYAPVYERIDRRLAFFPQYYRFMLSIALDLEDLGMPGRKAEAMVRWCEAQGLARGELSDLQRFEARRLMQRRGVEPLRETGLADRIRGFAAKSEVFALPNKKAAYELTHTVFYLSEYGRKDPGLGDAARRSLTYAGLIAWLEQNADLMAEICIALRQMGATPPASWEAWVTSAAGSAAIVARDDLSVSDDYHEWLVTNWAAAMAGQGAFAGPVPTGRLVFGRAPARPGALRPLSEAMFAMGDRKGGWRGMRNLLAHVLPDHAQSLLVEAAGDIPEFEAFFALFARAQAIELERVA
ncbi:DUF6902 family protein [Mesobacterium pallidum]|uniref:DUF6902 family protein n=1 Tax=Mesobacterium pallidum TaxID=2872037 RepID=UPI001EE1C67B|nr:hypothetical protein [Mesobacterium pallidum]